MKMMKSGSLAIATAVGMALSGAAAASSIEFYDIVDGSDNPILNAPVLVGGGGLSSVQIDIETTLESMAGYTAALELLLSDDEAQPDGEGAVVAGLNQHKVDIVQDTTSRWYVWGGDVASLLTGGTDGGLSMNGFLTLSEDLTAQPGGKDFLYYNARLVFTVVPEASQWLLLGAGLLAVGAVASRRRRALSHWA